MTTSDGIERAASFIANADALLICAGAGMGVDSGLPDFRGEGGFWTVYPALGRARIEFENIANPNAFRADPIQAWGFYGHRLKLYRETTLHDGFRILKEIAEKLPHGAFVFTSNVDGHFQKAGFMESRVYECHGSIHYMQCLVRCHSDVWSAVPFKPEVDEEHCRLINPLPRCPSCGGLARPNILMFSDSSWLSQQSSGKFNLLESWLGGVEKLAIIEIGAGTTIPSVRQFGQRQKGALIRINLTEPDIPSNKEGIPLKMGGLLALWQIEAVLRQSNFYE